MRGAECCDAPKRSHLSHVYTGVYVCVYYSGSLFARLFIPYFIHLPVPWRYIFDSVPFIAWFDGKRTLSFAVANDLKTLKVPTLYRNHFGSYHRILDLRAFSGMVADKMITSQSFVTIRSEGREQIYDKIEDQAGMVKRFRNYQDKQVRDRRCTRIDTV